MNQLLQNQIGKKNIVYIKKFLLFLKMIIILCLLKKQEKENRILNYKMIKWIKSQKIMKLFLKLHIKYVIEQHMHK